MRKIKMKMKKKKKKKKLDCHMSIGKLDTDVSINNKKYL